MSSQHSSDAAQALERHASDIAVAAAEHLLENHPRVSERFGNDALAVWTENLRQRLLELCAAITSGEVELFVSRVTWSRAAMRARNVESGDLDASLASLRAVIGPYLESSTKRPVAECLDAAMAAVSRETQEPESCTLDPGLLPERIALRYIQAVIAGNAIPGMAIVLDAIDDGLSVRDALIKVLLPAQREVGRLWHIDEISIAEEHMVTMTTQRLMAVLASRAQYAPDSGRTAVAAAVTGNIHDIGIRAIAYLLEFDGWRTIYLGADVPKSELPDAIECFEADVVLLSLALSSQLPALRRTIQAIRATAGHKVKIMVGGNGLNGAPDLWKELGADGFAETADDALAVAEELTVG